MTVSLEKSKHQQGVRAATRIGRKHGLAWYVVRGLCITSYCDNEGWPEGEGLGSSDGNIITSNMALWEPERVTDLCQREQERQTWLADLRQRGVDLEKMRALFAPA